MHVKFGFCFDVKFLRVPFRVQEFPSLSVPLYYFSWLLVAAAIAICPTCVNNRVWNIFLTKTRPSTMLRDWSHNIQHVINTCSFFLPWSNNAVRLQLLRSHHYSLWLLITSTPFRTFKSVFDYKLKQSFFLFIAKTILVRLFFL